jgi:serine/threonine protein kinase
MQPPLNDAASSSPEAPTLAPAAAEQGALTVSGPAGAQAAAPDLLPELTDHPRYRILGLLGRGGMGAVYKAEDRRMGRVVALKVIQSSLTVDAAAVQRFEHEVKAAAQLTHPNIVTAYDADQAGDVRFLVMEFVDGQNLADYLKTCGRLSVTEACDCVRQAAVGLHHAQERGMVHRDIKPHNLMRTREGTIKILDFGLARLVRSQQQGVSQLTQLTQHGVMMGTVDYMAPEQASDSRAADIRSDIYSLGCTLYQLLTGRVPFPEGGPIDKVIKHAVERPTPVSELRPEVPPALAKAVQRMMAKEPAGRFQTPAEVVSVLALFSETEPEVIPSVLPVTTPTLPTVLPAVPPAPRPSPVRSPLSREEREPVLRRLHGCVVGLRLGSYCYGLVTFLFACYLMYAAIEWWIRAPVYDGTGHVVSQPSFTAGHLFLIALATGSFMALTVLLSFGASQLRLGQGYFWVVAAAIAALLPLPPIFLLSFPVGLRVLARLSEPNVKAVFGRPGQ